METSPANSASEAELPARDTEREPRPEPDSLARLFLRFLRFGCLAFGGPVAQIGMIRQELVDELGWLSSERFNRALAVYQVLPGPEATELCIYMGTVARGRLGGVVAGAAFILPGFVLMLLLSWAALTVGLSSPVVAGAMLGLQPAVAALVVRAVHRIGTHALTTPRLVVLGSLGALAQFAGVHFALTLAFTGLCAVVPERWPRAVPAVLCTLFVAGSVWWATQHTPVLLQPRAETPAAWSATGTDGRAGVAPGPLFLSGLRAGLLTFGGAYTSIPFLRQDAVVESGWVNDGQFMQAIAINGVLPSPLVMFAAYIGLAAGGFAGALAMTAGIFLPAFSFTLIGHELIERLIHRRALHALLDGVTAGVVGIIAVTALELIRLAVPSVLSGPAVIFAAALIVIYRWKHRASVPLALLGAGMAGALLLSR